MKKTIFTILCLCGLLSTAFAQQTINPVSSQTKETNWVQRKNYLFLTLLEESKTLRLQLEADEVLQKLAAQKNSQLSEALKNCASKPACLIESLRFSEEEIKTVSLRLSQLCSKGSLLENLVKQSLAPSLAYGKFENHEINAVLQKAWMQDARGVNWTIGVYLGGQKPNYPLIDSIAFDITKKGYYQLLGDLTRAVQAKVNGSKLFFLPTLTSALFALEINEREQIADYEPMASGVNKPVVDRLKTVAWNKYPYSLILVPGAGPDVKDMPLSAEGMMRCRVAAVRYFEGKAPLIVVSGGKVHPYKTPYNEAIEMKKYMVEKLHIPANAILVEPHARHTTTNMRNTARLIFQYGIPADKPCITSTSVSQSQYIHELNLDKRCEKELGYVPYRKGKRISETEAEFYPLIESMMLNSLEPMDP